MTQQGSLNDYEELLPPRFWKTISKPVAQREEGDGHFCAKMLQPLAFFAKYELAQTIKIIDAATFVHLEPGEILFKEGDVGEEAYIVLRGCMGMVRRKKKKNRALEDSRAALLASSSSDDSEDDNASQASNLEGGEAVSNEDGRKSREKYSRGSQDSRPSSQDADKPKHVLRDIILKHAGKNKKAKKKTVQFSSETQVRASSASSKDSRAATPEDAAANVIKLLQTKQKGLGTGLKEKNKRVGFLEVDREKDGTWSVTKHIVLATKSQGVVFGEIAVATGCGRTATACALVECDLLKVKQKTFMEICTIQENTERAQFLGTVQGLTKCSKQMLTRLSFFCHPMSFSAGEVLQQQGDPTNHSLAMVVSGTCKLFRRVSRIPGKEPPRVHVGSGPGSYQSPSKSLNRHWVPKKEATSFYDFDLACLSSGDWFGDVSLFFGRPNQETVVAASRTEILTVARVDLSACFPASFEKLRQQCQVRMEHRERRFKELYQKALEDEKADEDLPAVPNVLHTLHKQTLERRAPRPTYKAVREADRHFSVTWQSQIGMQMPAVAMQGRKILTGQRSLDGDILMRLSATKESFWEMRPNPQLPHVQRLPQINNALKQLTLRNHNMNNILNKGSINVVRAAFAENTSSDGEGEETSQEKRAQEQQQPQAEEGDVSATAFLTEFDHLRDVLVPGLPPREVERSQSVPLSTPQSLLQSTWQMLPEQPDEQSRVATAPSRAQAQRRARRAPPRSTPVRRRCAPQFQHRERVVVYDSVLSAIGSRAVSENR